MTFLNLALTVWAAMASTATASPAASSPADAYFCTRQGTVLNYERRSAENGRLWWKHSESIDAVRSKSGILEIDITSSIVSDIGKAPLKEPVKSQVTVRSNGTVEVDVSKAAEEAARQKFAALDFTSSGGTSILPADLAPGEKLQDIHSVVSWSGIKLTIDYTERSVLRRETITVPAGTFDCIVVQEHKLEKAPLHRRDRITLTWYAPGYGMIRHDTLFTNGKAETSEVLVSVSK